MIDCENYNANRGIYSPLMEHNGCVFGYWLMGNDYRNKTRYYGAYPPSYLRRIKLLFPTEVATGAVLHCFAGMVAVDDPTREVRFDVRDDLDPAPDVVGDASTLSHYFPPAAFDLILADPPYGDNHVRYGTARVNKKRVVHECAAVLKDGGYLVWLDTVMPMWAKADGWRLAGTIGMCQSTNHQTRLVTILEQNYELRTR
jgi:hypothetical protein